MQMHISICFKHKIYFQVEFFAGRWFWDEFSPLWATEGLLSLRCSIIYGRRAPANPVVSGSA
jgi:hypothetical protein